eukprot:363580-Chlamydomonas_euryale.AAC.8
MHASAKHTAAHCKAKAPPAPNMSCSRAGCPPCSLSAPPPSTTPSISSARLSAHPDERSVPAVHQRPALLQPQVAQRAVRAAKAAEHDRVDPLAGEC